MPDMPAWFAKLALWFVMGLMSLLGLPFIVWVGKREAERVLSRIETIDELHEKTEQQAQEIQALKSRLSEDHGQVEELLEEIREEVRA